MSALAAVVFALTTQGTTGSPSAVKISIPEGSPGKPLFTRVRVCDSGGYANATNATIAAKSGSGTSIVETHTSGKDLTFKSSVSAAASKALTIAGDVVDGETVTLGSEVYEFDTHDASTITAGHRRVNISASATKAQGTLRLDTIPTANDIFRIGAVTYVCVANGAGDSAGEVSIGTTLAAFETNLLAAVGGTDGFNTAHPTVTIAAGTDTAATTTLTSNNTNVTTADTVTIGNKTYTFRTALTPTEGEVLIGGSADATLLNLIRAINHTGTADTDYKCAAAHTQVTAAASVTSHAFVISAITTQSAAVQNALASTKSATTLSFTGSTLTGAIDKYVITAKAGGTAGNSLVTTETFTATNNTFDAAVLGTTTPGVDCTNLNAGIALAAAINAVAGNVTASNTSGVVTITAVSSGTAGNSIVIGETMANGSFAGGATLLSGGTDSTSRTIEIALTNATAETVTLRVGPSLFSPIEADYNVTKNVTHAA